MPKLLLKFNAAVLKEIPIAKDVTTVGRKPDNDVVIDNPAVSSYHCKIMLVGDTFFVEDNNSIATSRNRFRWRLTPTPAKILVVVEEVVL